jgi:hypothetical protein
MSIWIGRVPIISIENSKSFYVALFSHEGFLLLRERAPDTLNANCQVGGLKDKVLDEKAAKGASTLCTSKYLIRLAVFKMPSCSEILERRT